MSAPTSSLLGRKPRFPNFDISTHFKNTNSILIVCVVILVLIALIGYKFSTCFIPGCLMGSCNKEKKSKENTSASHECKIVTPQCVFGALATEGSPVLIVNVLSEKMPVFIGAGKPDEQRSVSKGVFEEMIKQSKGQIPKSVEMVVLMCAGWSCSAAKNYCEDLQKRGVDVSRVVDYAGGLHEWCVYNKLNPQVFKLFNLRKPDENRVAELSPQEVNKLLSGTAHGYNNNTLIQSNEKPISPLCKAGEELPALLVPSVNPENGGESGPAPVPSVPVEEPIDLEVV